MKSILRFSLLLLCLLSAKVAEAATSDGDTLCVRLKAGTVDVFAPDLLAGYDQTADSLRITLKSDTTLRYALSEVASVDNQPGELPVFTSYKFNDKFNDQLTEETFGTITPDAVTASVGGIGKWLTASFKLSNEAAKAYVDGVEQESKTSRLHFDVPRVYTLSVPGMRTLTHRKVKDEVWSTPGENVKLQTVTLTADMLSTNAPSNYDEGLENMIDGDPSTFFHSTWGSGSYEKLPEDEHPYVQINLAEDIAKLRFSYTTRSDASNRCPLSFLLQASNDGTNWTDVRTLTEEDGLPSGGVSLQYTSPTIDLGGSYQYLRLTMLSASYKNYLCLAEFSLSEVVWEGESEEPVLISPAVYEYAWMPFGRDVTVTVDWATDHTTNVPRIDIDIENGAMPADKVTYLNAHITIDGGGVFADFEDDVRIKGRGNSSWAGQTGKSPYRLKFTTAVKPFGLKKGKNWVLLANKQTGSMLSNAVAMKVARLVGTAGANDIIPVELYMNGKYRGSYNFTQHVGLSNNSIDLADETNATLLELDSYYDEDYKFRDTAYKLAVNVKDPDIAELEDGTERFALIQSDFNNFTSTLKNGTDEYAELVDAEMLARFLLVNEYVLNYELGHPKSSFLYKEDLLALHSRYVFGPVWDFDWGFGYQKNYNYCTTGATDNYYEEMTSTGHDFFNALRYNSEEVRRASYRLWKDIVENHLDELADFVDEYYAYARPSFVNNAGNWGDGNNYATIAANTRNWMVQRAQYVYNNIETFDLSTPLPIKVGDVNRDGAVTIADVVCVVNHILGQENETFDKAQADADGSGSITINDAVHIVALAMNQPADLTRHLRLPMADATLRPAAFDATLGVTTSMPLALCIDGDNYRSLQMDLRLPEGMTLDDVTLPELPGMSVHTAETETGTYRLALYAEDGRTLPMGQTTLQLGLTAGQMIAEADRVVSISGAMMADTAGEDNRLAPRSASFRLNATTGIATPTGESHVSGGDALTIESLVATDVRIYTADGRLVRTVAVPAGTTSIKLPRGIYIVNKEKVIIK